MLVVEYQSKSYYRFLEDITQIADHKNRFLITFNAANAVDLQAAVRELIANTDNDCLFSTAIKQQMQDAGVSDLFAEVRSNRNMLLFQHADILFDKRTAVKNGHERETEFNINHLFKNIAKHNGIVILATDKMQTLSSAMSTKMDVVIRFPSS
ncbi:AAA family ATPase [Psychromonas sp. PT13]|uniref:AAA family ATPase n=1 Tax=Psychromonas sp. PT13 TaxID=3439547 RepID=UPI003EC0442C